MDKIDQQYLNEIVGVTEPGETDTQLDLQVHEENTTIEELEVRVSAVEQQHQAGNEWLNYFSSDGHVLLQALGKTLGTGDDDGDQEVIDKFLRVRR